MNRSNHRLSRRHFELAVAETADAGGVVLAVTARGQNPAYYHDPTFLGEPGGWAPIPTGGVELANGSLIAALGDGRGADDAKQCTCECQTPVLWCLL